MKEDEKEMAQTIVELWAMRQGYRKDIRSTRTRIRGLDQRLGELLSQIKVSLAKPGRAGGWSSWLAKHGIGRSAADRMVAKFAAEVQG